MHNSIFTIKIKIVFRNYIKIAIRNLWRNKGFSAINILGLAIGIATCLIIMLFVQNELGYDRFNKKADRMVRVVFKVTMKGDNLSEPHVMPPVARVLKTDYPEVQEATRLRNYGSPRMVYGDKSFNEDAFAFVDSNFFQVFTLPLVKGDAAVALAEPNSIVITRELARKYFGIEDPMGKLLVFKESNTAYKVTGMIDKVPVNAHFHFEMFASMASLPESREASWMRSEFFTYLVLPEGYDYQKLQAKLPQVIDKYLSPQMSRDMGMSVEEFRKKGNTMGLFLQPLTAIHLHSEFANDLSAPGDVRYVYIFGAIALFMLAIACINFMNLSTAGASKRAREVGIRKVLGSMKQQLVWQFLLESILLTAVALLLAIFLVDLALPLFNKLSGKDLVLPLTTDPWLLPSLLLFGILTGILAGGYPAFFLSAFKPVFVLKGKFSAGRNSIGLRSGLVVFQFFVSITLIIGTIVVYDQLSYIQHKKLGYDKAQVLVLPQAGILGSSKEVFRQRLLNDPRILNVSTSGYLPAGPSGNNNFFIYAEGNPTQLIKSLRYDVDYHYIPTLGMQMAAGRNFAPIYATDSAGIILNETAAKELGWEKDAVGHSVGYAYKNQAQSLYRVVGVVKDFHFRSMHEKISPLVMVLGDHSGNVIVKARAGDLPGLLTSLKKEWTALTAEVPFTYSFMDDRLNDTYRAEQRTGWILGIFAGLTIFVACLGLFGLAMFTAEQRNKEIGVRKVLGASVLQIVSLLSKDFLRLVLIAAAVAFPLAGWVMSKWLQDFAYRISIGWWVFALAGTVTVVIALLTVSYQAIRAAMANPVESLRTE
ncbi:MAG: FtsX-like permease family protein [Sediminibacterium sp.]|nr:FtsX-like permease family protein [Sediminibacterium sp.]